MDESQPNLETDPRFPSGPWIGYFLQPALPGKHRMELALTFQKGEFTGEGRDWVGHFVLRGRYSIEDGRCRWTKRYLSRHDVFYRGFNEGKGIWGTWEIPGIADPRIARGGFHIWPVGMGDPTDEHLHEEADIPDDVEEEVIEFHPVKVS